MKSSAISLHYAKGMYMGKRGSTNNFGAPVLTVMGPSHLCTMGIINQLCHPYTNPSIVIVAKDLMVFVQFIILQTQTLSWTLFSQCQTKVFKQFGAPKAYGSLGMCLVCCG